MAKLLRTPRMRNIHPVFLIQKPIATIITSNSKQNLIEQLKKTFETTTSTAATISVAVANSTVYSKVYFMRTRVLSKDDMDFDAETPLYKYWIKTNSLARPITHSFYTLDGLFNHYNTAVIIDSLYYK